MTGLLRFIDRRLRPLPPTTILVVAGIGVLLVESVDYVTGYEVSLSLLYLGPIAVAAWYAGRWAGFTIAVVSCIGWYVADQAAGGLYSYAAIPIWNALVRLGFFLITAHLLTALRKSLLGQRHLARTDSLTGLFRRRVFEERFEHDLALARRHGSPLTVAYIDVDDFKAINDKHGHAAGDEVLIALGRVLRLSVREADTGARLGGDEFALLMPDTDDAGARHAISKLMGELDVALAATGWGATCSVGVVTLPGSAASLEQAIAAADEVMYRVKQSGKSAVAYRVLDEMELQALGR